MKQSCLGNKCQLCDYVGPVGFHIRTHKMTKREYYDKFIKEEGEGICFCGTPTNFFLISKFPMLSFVVSLVK